MVRNGTNIYKLERYYDDPRFEGFGSKPLWDSPLGRPGESWQTKKLRPLWAGVRARGRVRLFNDYPGINIIPAFSTRAVEALREFLEPNGELFPFKTDRGEYFAYNILTTADVLDVRRSKIDRLEIWRYELKVRKLNGLTIFRMPQVGRDVYVTQGFVDRATKCGLQGMHFQKVWPFPKSVDWWKIARDDAERHKRAGISKGRDPKAHSFVIDLKLSSPATTETPRETRAIKKVMDKLDAILAEPASKESLIGSVEGYDKSKPGMLRLIISCPDAGALERKLRPFLAALEWPYGFTARKKRADFREWSGVFD